MPCQIWSSYEDNCKTPFEHFNQKLSCKLYYEDKNRMIRINQMSLKIGANIIIWLYVVESFAMLMNHTWNLMIREKKQ